MLTIARWGMRYTEGRTPKTSRGSASIAFLVRFPKRLGFHARAEHERQAWALNWV